MKKIKFDRLFDSDEIEIYDVFFDEIESTIIKQCTYSTRIIIVDNIPKELSVNIIQNVRMLLFPDVLF